MSTEQLTQEITLDQCLNLIFKSNSNVQCQNCNTLKEIQVSFSKLPHCLIVYLKRFFFDTKQNVFKKKRKNVEFPETLELTDSQNNKAIYS